MKLPRITLGNIKPKGIRPPKPGRHYYVCKKCGHHFEGLLPICPKCLSPNVEYDVTRRY